MTATVSISRTELERLRAIEASAKQMASRLRALRSFYRRSDFWMGNGQPIRPITRDTIYDDVDAEALNEYERVMRKYPECAHTRVSPATDQTKFHCHDCSQEFVPDSPERQRLLDMQIAAKNFGSHAPRGTWNTTSMECGE